MGTTQSRDKDMVRSRDELENILQDSDAAPISLPLEFLKYITRDFSTELELGRGGFGVVYKGVLRSGKVIAVKKLFEIKLKEEMFQNEVSNLMGIKHKNVVQFLGYCAESRWEVMDERSETGKHIFAEIPKRLLCFEYVRNQGLDKHISDVSLGLEWNKRFDIIKGICNGLHFLHECRIVHLDLKPENILMDSSMTPKIADFGLSTIFGQKQSRIVTKNCMGTRGYMAPEYIDQGVVSNKADIFSLGVILIEIITGDRVYPHFQQDSPNTSFMQFTEKVLASWRERFICTPEYKPMEIYTQQVRQCVTLALECLDPIMEKRPTAKDLIKMFSGVDQVSETGTIMGRASSAGLDKAVDVLDTLGCGITSLNLGSGFLYGRTNRGNKVCILAFEVANTIAKASNLCRSCSDESIKELKEEILHSDGVRILISSNPSELLHIAAIDKREELAILSREVIRFGDLCIDPIWHNLGCYFDKLKKDSMPQDHSKEHIETTVQQLISLAQNTSELYHELHSLDRFEQDFQRKFHEEESVPAARRESVMILDSEVKRQRNLVKKLKKKSLWSRTLEDIVKKLVDIVIFLDRQIRDAFGEAVPVGTDVTEQVQNKRLGPCGLALHYANIINQIENIVSRPLSLPPSARDNLYHGLPITVKSALRSRLQSVNTEEERSVSQIKAEMQKTLRWILPIAENTTRAHQGFGRVGEWANFGSEMDEKSGSQHRVTRVQTLHHADKAATEQHMLELVVLLHHLVVQVKSRVYGNNKSGRQERSRSSRRGSLELAAQLDDTRHNTSPMNDNGGGGACPSPLSDSERETLDRVSFQRTRSYGRSKSCEPWPRELAGEGTSWRGTLM